MLRACVVSLVFAFLVGWSDGRAWPAELPAPPPDVGVIEPRSAWLPSSSQLRTGANAFATLFDLYSKRVLRNQTERYRAVHGNQGAPIPYADNIKVVPIAGDLSASGTQYFSRLPPGTAVNAGEGGEDELIFSDEDRIKSRLPATDEVPNRQSKITNGPLLNVTAMQGRPQRISRNCFRSGPSSYCEDVQDYPAETIRKLLSNDVSGLTKFLTSAEIKPANSPVFMGAEQEGAVIHTRVKPLASDPASAHVSSSADDEYRLCGAMRTSIYPKAGQSVDGEWLTIVNQDNIRQSLSIEKCHGSEKPCKFARNFPAGFKAVCKQKYMMHKLAVFKDNELKQATFSFPSCCVCEVRPIGAPEDDLLFTNEDALELMSEDST